MKRKDLRPQSYVKQICCDRCGREAEVHDTDCEFVEFTSIEYKAGYGSVFGDGNKVEVDLCQHCVKELLGPWLRVMDSTKGFDRWNRAVSFHIKLRRGHSMLLDFAAVFVKVMRGFAVNLRFRGNRRAYERALPTQL